jgi:hypothetical protein
VAASDSHASAVGLRRLYHQRISHPRFKHAGEVAAWFGAMQGQDYLGTKWAFGLRLPGSTDADIEQAIIDRKVIRAWVLRGTLHYVAPADIHWLLDLLAPRQIAGNARRYKELELDDSTLTHSTDLIAVLLRDGAQLTRDEIFTYLNDKGISTAGQRGVFMLQRAALEKLIYQGALRRNVTTFLALDPGKTLPKDEALAELARRYFTSHAPATLADFATWAGLPIGEARAGLADAKSVLVEEMVEGQSYWLPRDETPEQPPSPLYLLPGFDEYVLGYKDRTAVLDPTYNNNICPGGNGMFSPTIVSEGRIIGTWKRALKKKTVEIVPDLFPPHAASFDLDHFTAAAEGYAAFLTLQPTIIKPA